jgi:hypothetical protein
MLIYLQTVPVYMEILPGKALSCIDHLSYSKNIVIAQALGEKASFPPG